MRTISNISPQGSKFDIPDLKAPVTITDPSPASLAAVKRKKNVGGRVRVIHNGAAVELSFLARNLAFSLDYGCPKAKLESPVFQVWSEQYGETYLLFDLETQQWYLGPFLSPEQKLLITIHGLRLYGAELSKLAYPDLLNYIVGHYFDTSGEWLERHFEKAFGVDVLDP